MPNTGRSPASLPVDVSVVAPAHNEEGSLEELVHLVVETLEASGHTFEIVLIDDASTDRTQEVLAGLVAREGRVIAQRLTVRSGQSAALAYGLRLVRGAIVVTIDADLQNDPRDIPLLIEHLDQYDVVSGVRQERHDSIGRRLASRVANRARRALTGDPFTDIGCSLKAYRADFLREIPWFNGIHRFLPIWAYHRGARVKEVAVRHRPRERGKSKYAAVRGRLWVGLNDALGVRWLLGRDLQKGNLECVEIVSKSPASSEKPTDTWRTGSHDL